jgi:phosphohistidine phosphatase
MLSADNATLKIRGADTVQLLLWRHAEAEDVAASDLARRLTPKGERQALRMAAWLRQQLGASLVDWRVIASPAVRTQATAKALQLPIETIVSLAPDATPNAVLQAAAWPGLSAHSNEMARHTIVVGHQPTLGMVAARLLHGEDGYLSVKKGAMWWFETRERDGQVQTVLKAVTAPDQMSE